MNERSLDDWLMKQLKEKREKKKRENWKSLMLRVWDSNQRNKRFNETISRSYDEETAKIRQNLERGTAF
jgi:hypothetical protein